MTPRRDPVTLPSGKTRLECFKALLGQAEKRQPWYRKLIGKWRWPKAGVPVRRNA